MAEKSDQENLGVPEKLLDAVEKMEVAFVPIGGTFTMDPEQAADCINLIRP